jgi:HAD superfamily hydrolase (TIGR01509 family)
MIFSSGKPSAVIFDLDGTLVSSSLNFAKICNEIGCREGTDVLAFMDSLPEQQKREAEKIVYTHELRDAESAKVIDGVVEVLSELKRNNIDTGIVTRNSLEATRIKLERTNIEVEHVITREAAKPKPAPDALIKLANKWNHVPKNCCYVGDYRYDLEAALNANMHAIWFTNNIKVHPEYGVLADLKFNHYDEFVSQLSDYWKVFSKKNS